MKTQIQKLLCCFFASICVECALASTNVFKLQPLPFPGAAQLQLTGPPGSNFVVQTSSNLALWQGLWYDSFQSNTYTFLDLQSPPVANRFYRGVLTNGPIQLQLANTNGIAQVTPMTLLQINATGLTTNTPVYVQFFTSNSIISDVPPVAISPTNLVVLVPPLLSPGGTTFTNGLVSGRIVQYSAGQLVSSKPFLVGNVQAPPPSTLPPGTVTLDFLNASLNAATNILANLPGSPLDSTNLESSLSNSISTLEGIIANVQEAVTNPSYTFSLGTISGQPLIVGQRDLQICDNFLVADLLGIAAADQSTQPILGPQNPGQYSCLASDASAAAQAATEGYDQNTAALIQETVIAPRQAVVCAAPQAFMTSYQVVGGAAGLVLGVGLLAGASYAALAVPTAMLLYITIEQGGGMIALGGAMGQTGLAAKQFVQNGVSMLDNLKWGIVKGVIGNYYGGIATVLVSAHSLIGAFSSTSTVTESYVGTLTITGTGTSPNSPGWTPDPLVTTETGGPANAALEVMGSLLSGPFSGTISEAGVTVTFSTPAQTGPTVDGYTPTIPATSSQSSLPATIGAVSGTGNSVNPIFSNFSISTAGASTSVTITSSISVAPVTGVVSLTINVQSTTTTESPPSTTVITESYNLTRQ